MRRKDPYTGGGHAVTRRPGELGEGDRAQPRGERFGADRDDRLAAISERPMPVAHGPAGASRGDVRLAPTGPARVLVMAYASGVQASSARRIGDALKHHVARRAMGPAKIFWPTGH